MLSILTTWGLVRPIYMPEGIGPATGILHTLMTNVFKKVIDHTVVIFDIFLVVCQNYDDCYNKCVSFITICSERNVILGMKKSKIGYTDATFFGYLIKDGTYQMTQERKDSVSSLVFPLTKNRHSLS